MTKVSLAKLNDDLDGDFHWCLLEENPKEASKANWIIRTPGMAITVCDQCLSELLSVVRPFTHKKRYFEVVGNYIFMRTGTTVRKVIGAPNDVLIDQLGVIVDMLNSLEDEEPR